MSLINPFKGVGRVEGTGMMGTFCRAVTSSMDGYGDVISETSATRRAAAEAFDKEYCEGMDGVWRSKQAEAERIERIRKGGRGRDAEWCDKSGKKEILVRSLGDKCS